MKNVIIPTDVENEEEVITIPYEPSEEEIQAARDYIANYLNVGYLVSDKVEYKDSKLLECYKSFNEHHNINTITFIFDPNGCEKENQRFREFFNIDSRYDHVNIEAIYFIDSDDWNVQGSTSYKEALSINRDDDDHYQPSEDEYNDALKEINKYVNTEVHDLKLENCYNYRDIITKDQYVVLIFGFASRDEEIRIQNALNEKYRNADGNKPVDPNTIKDSNFCVTHNLTNNEWNITVSMTPV